MPILRDNVTAEDVYGRFFKFGSKFDNDYVDFTAGPDLAYGQEAKSLDDINWYSIEDLELNEELLSPAQHAGISALLNPHLLKKHVQPKYITNTLLCSMVEVKGFELMCQCGTLGCRDERKRAQRDKVWCNGWKYCDRCAGKERAAYYTKLAHYFDRSMYNAYFLTVTYKHKFVFNESTYDLIEEAWNKLNAYIKTKKKHFDGTFKVEELSVDRLYPNILVNPHLHLVVVSEEELNSEMLSSLPDGIKVHVKPITDKEQWLYTLNYMIKSIDFGKTYAASWTPQTSKVVNRNVAEFIRGYKVVFFGRHQISTSGVFHKKCKDNVLMTKRQYNACQKQYKKLGKQQKACNLENIKIEYEEQSVPEEINMTNEKQAFSIPTMAETKDLFGRLPGLAMSRIINPAIEKSSPYLAGGLRKLPISDSMKQNIGSHLAPSAADYSSGIKDMVNRQAMNSQYNQAIKMGPAQLLGTEFNDAGADTVSKVTDATGAAAGLAAAPGFISDIPRMGANLLSTVHNAASKVPLLGTLTKPLGYLGQAGEKALDYGAGVGSKAVTGLLGARAGGATMRGLGAYSKALGPLSVIMSIPAVDRLANRSSAWQVNPENFDRATGFVRPQHMLDSENITHGLINSMIPQPLSMLRDLLYARVRNNPNPQNGYDQVLGKLLPMQDRAVAHIGNGVANYFSRGAFGILPALVDDSVVTKNNNMLIRAATTGANDLKTKLFQEAAALKDQGYSNPLRGWYDSQSPQDMQQYLGSLHDEDLIKRIQELNPNR